MKPLLSALCAILLFPAAAVATCGYCDFVPSGGIYGCAHAQMPFICLGGGGCSMIAFDGCGKGKMLTLEEVQSWENQIPCAYDGAACAELVLEMLANDEDIEVEDLAEFKWTISDGYPWSMFFTFGNQLEALQWLEAKGLITDPTLSRLLRDAE